MKLNKAGKLIVAILVSEMAGIIGSVFTTPAIPTWYATLEKPFFNPPSWVFAPVWTTLFVLMGIAAYLVWEKGFEKKEVRKALSIFGVQLVLNTMWSILFFGAQSPLLAFIEIIILWFAILLTIVKFWRISKNAGLLLIPYIAWVSFASVLNLSIWLLN
ncbi:MAG: tryptophan-rich sensory protein [Candidatus Altiarchaeota archaeon]|nr:tryptophan-rich sensory protein [Candidatus Altiarchaeota archaeon]